MSAPANLSRKVLSAVASRPPLRDFLLAVAVAVGRAGGRAYIVGGTVRDIIEGRAAKDIDLMVAGLSEKGLSAALAAIPAAEHGIRRITRVGKTFPVLKIRTAWAAGEIDVARARRVSPPTSGARHRKVREGDAAARQDASLRDFTVNSLQFRLRAEGRALRGTLLDPEGGGRDIDRRRIRAVGAPGDRFREDPVRMLRAIRLRAERDGYTIERSTWDAIRRTAPVLLPSVPGDRLAAELARAFTAAPARAARDLLRSGILGILLPDPPAWGKSRALRLVRRIEILERRRRPLDGPLPFFAALLVEQAETEGGGSARAPSVPIRRRGIPRGRLDRKAFRIPGVAATVARLRFPQARLVVRLLEGHLVLLHAPLLRNRRALLESEFSRWDDPETLLSFHAAAQQAAGAPIPRFPALLRNAASLPHFLSGKDLRDLGYPPGPEIAGALEEIREKILSGALRTRAQAVAAARRMLRTLPPGSRSGVE